MEFLKLTERNSATTPEDFQSYNEISVWDEAWEGSLKAFPKFYPISSLGLFVDKNTLLLMN